MQAAFRQSARPLRFIEGALRLWYNSGHRMEGRQAVSTAHWQDEHRLFGSPQPAGLLAFAPMFDYLYCLLASTVLVNRALLGGALCIAAQVAALASRLIQPGRLRSLPPGYRIAGVLLTLVASALSFALLLIYPFQVEEPRLWLLFGVVALVLGRSATVRFLHLSCLKRKLSKVQRAFRLAEFTLLFCLLMAPLLFFSLPTDSAWYLLGGYVIVAALEALALYKRPGEQQLLPGNMHEEEPEQLSQAKAYGSFRRLSLLSLTALQVTMFLIYTYIGSTAGDLLLCMGIALVFTYVPERLTRAFLRRGRSRQRDPSNVLLLGLSLWIISLLALAQQIRMGELLWSLLALGFCTTGTTVAMAALQALDSYLDPIFRFATGQAPDAGQQQLKALQTGYATLAGQVVALVGLSLMLFFGEGGAADSPVLIRPTLIIPALMLVILALVAALRNPLESQHLVKLQRFLLLKENGETNLPLQHQLENVVMRAARRHYGIKLLMIILRPLFYSRVAGREHVKLDRDTACIFTCNHGELYGPIVTNLYIPYSFRPWVISEMAELPEIADYIYKYTVKRQRWLPERWKMPISRGLAPFLNWIMHSIECIPVYRNKPSALMRTLRLSAQALEAGDNLLIFPENPDHPSQEKPGYLRDSIGPFFHGFVTVAQLYERRTGKCAQFYPIYADKRRRVLTFGPPTRYDASRHPAEEQQRISDYLRQEMLRMAGLAEQEA